MANEEKQLHAQLPPLGGYKIDDPENQITDNYFPAGKNVIVYESKLVKRQGYTHLLDRNRDILGTNYVMEGTEYGDVQGNVHLVFATTRGLFEYNASGSSPTWTDRTGTALTGSVSNPIFMSRVGGLNLDNLYITNGIDPIKVWNGTGDYSDLETDGYRTLRANCLVGHKSHLVLGDVTEQLPDIPHPTLPTSGAPTIQEISHFPYRVRWSAVGDATNWTGTGAGFVNLVEDEAKTKIQTFHALRELLIVYKEGSIYSLNFDPSLNSYISDLINPDRGAISPKAVVPILNGLYHLVISEDNIFLFDGFNYSAIGDPIKREFYGDLHWEFRNQIFCQVLPSRYEVIILLPTGTSQVCNRAYILNYENGFSWSAPIEYHHPASSIIYSNVFFNYPRVFMGIAGDVVVLNDGNIDLDTAVEANFRLKLNSHGTQNLKTIRQLEISGKGNPIVKAGGSNNLIDDPTLEATGGLLKDSSIGVPSVSTDPPAGYRYITVDFTDDTTEEPFEISEIRYWYDDMGGKD